MKLLTARRAFLLSIKYAPVILVLTASIKIWLGAAIESPYTSVNIINWCLNVWFLIVAYIQGKAMHFCWKHRALCRVALWQYVYYLAFILNNTPPHQIQSISKLNVIGTLLLLVYYEKTDWKCDPNDRNCRGISRC